MILSIRTTNGAIYWVGATWSDNIKKAVKFNEDQIQHLSNYINMWDIVVCEDDGTRIS